MDILGTLPGCPASVKQNVKFPSRTEGDMKLTASMSETLYFPSTVILETHTFFVDRKDRVEHSCTLAYPGPCVRSAVSVWPSRHLSPKKTCRPKKKMSQSTLMELQHVSLSPASFSAGGVLLANTASSSIKLSETSSSNFSMVSSASFSGTRFHLAVWCLLDAEAFC